MPLSFPNSPTDGQVVTISGRQWTFSTGKGWAGSGGMAAQGLAATDSPQFAGVNFGDPSDTTLSRLRAGTLGIEGKAFPYIFAQSGVPVSVGAVTVETVLATVSFAGGELGPNGYLVIYTLWSNNSSANNKTFNIRVGGVAGTQVLSLVNTTNLFASTARYVISANSQSSQKFMAIGQPTTFTQGAASIGTSAINMASAWDLVFTGTKANAGDTLTLEGYQVLVCYGA